MSMEPLAFNARTIEKIKTGFNVLELGANYFRFSDDGVVYTVTNNGNEWICSSAKEFSVYGTLEEIEIDFS